MNTLLIILVVLLLVGFGAAPQWGHSWGWGPSGVVGIVVVVLIIALLLGRI